MDWDEAMNYTITEGAQGICPADWHIPTDVEWETMLTYVGDSASCKLRQEGSLYWNDNECATNEKDFSARGAGRTNSYTSFLSLKAGTFFWTSTESTPDMALQYTLFNFNEDVSQINHLKTSGLSVRCIKDN